MGVLVAVVRVFWRSLLNGRGFRDQLCAERREFYLAIDGEDI